MTKTILITGAAGYIGSHVVEAALEQLEISFNRLILLDDLSQGTLGAVDALRLLAKEKNISIEFIQISLLDLSALSKVLDQHKPEVVIHFAAKIDVAESVVKPELYFENNLRGSQNLLAAMKAANCKRLVFSSTAAVYGKVDQNEPILEDAPKQPINPYGESKLKVEIEIEKASLAWGLSAVIFRYFNAAGASIAKRLGECHEPETHLIPLLLRALLKSESLKVFGTDYATRDGSCIRDYVHVVDLARAHLMGLRYLQTESDGIVKVFNLGTENGNTVLEVIAAAEKVLKVKAIYEVYPRRMGDPAVLVADTSKVRKELGWLPIHSSIDEIIRTALNWETKNKPRQ